MPLELFVEFASSKVVHLALGEGELEEKRLHLGAALLHRRDPLISSLSLQGNIPARRRGHVGWFHSFGVLADLRRLLANALTSAQLAIVAQVVWRALVLWVFAGREGGREVLRQCRVWVRQSAPRSCTRYETFRQSLASSTSKNRRDLGHHDLRTKMPPGNM